MSVTITWELPSIVYCKVWSPKFLQLFSIGSYTPATQPRYYLYTNIRHRFLVLTDFYVRVKLLEVDEQFSLSIQAYLSGDH